jgi:tetratricopeptide (TPR) repeat protein
LRKYIQPFIILAMTALAVVAAAGTGFGAPKPAASAAPAASATPAPLPTATPEPPSIAIPRLEAKIKANPNDKPSLNELASYYLGTGHPDKALALSQRLMSLGDKSAQTYFLDGAANEGLGKVKEAIADYENATNLEPTNAQILLTLTNLYMRTDRPADAERVAKRATVFNAGDKHAWENYGLVLAQEKKYDEARQSFDKAAQLDPKDATPIVLEARSYVDQSAIALALQLFDKATQIDPKNGEALLGKARLQGANHDVKGSIATYETLLGLVPDDEGKASVLIEELRVYQNEKMTTEADAAIKRAVAAYPKVASVHLAYGDFLAGNKDQAGAAAEWTTALGDKRDNPDALQRLGVLALSQNKPADALSYFYRLAQVVPNDPNVYAQIGQVEADQKHWDKARDAYRHAFEMTHAPQPLAGLAVADYQLKNYKECGQISDALEKNAATYLKQQPQFYLVMGKCYTTLGQKDKARAAYVHFQAYVKPGSDASKELQKLINDLNTIPKPKPTAAPSHR